MQRCLIAHTNLAAATGASISVDAAASGHPASRLTDGILGVRCWLDNHTGTITVDLGDPATYGAKQWSLVALLGTNLTANMTVVVKSNDSDSGWASPAWSQVMNYEHRRHFNFQNNIWHFLSDARAERYVQFSIEEGGDSIVADAEDAVLGGSSVNFPTYAKFGQVVVAKPLQVGRNFTRRNRTEDQYGVRVHQSEEAIRIQRTSGPRRTWQLNWKNVRRLYREQIEEAWHAVCGAVIPFLLIPDPEDEARFASWVRWPQILGTDYDFFRLLDHGETPLTATEEPYATEILTEE